MTAPSTGPLTEDAASRRRGAALRAAGLVAGVAALAVVATFVPVREAATAVAGLGAAGWFGVGLLAIVLLGGLVPRTPISMACGALLGPLAGPVVAVVAALVAAVLTALAGRSLGREFFVRHAGGRLRRLDGWLSGQRTLGIAAIRALPIGPFGLAGYLYGATGVPWRHYLLGTVIAAPPAGVSYALLGAAVVSDDPFNPVTLLPMAFSMLLTVVAVTAWRRRTRAAQRAGVSPR